MFCPEGGSSGAPLPSEGPRYVAPEEGGPQASGTDDDPELVRKKRELQEITELIERKKAALRPAGSSPSAPGAPPGALQHRVRMVLEQRGSSWGADGPGPRRPPHAARMNRSRGGVLQEDHPLKLRVKALMRTRTRTPDTQVSDTAPPGPGDAGISPGFQRFLSILNNGVDMNWLSRIVNDDGDQEPPNIQPLAVENQSGQFFMGQSQGSTSRPSLPGPRHMNNNRDRKSTLSSQEGPLIPQQGQNNQPIEPLPGCHRSKSPLPVMKKRKEGDEENPKVEEQHQQLQNVLKSLGLSWEEEEMTELAKRTQERLYGKKKETVREESRKQDPHNRDGKSSSSSSCSGSRSASPSPPQLSCSSSKDSKRRGASDGGSLGGRKHQDHQPDPHPYPTYPQGAGPAPADPSPDPSAENSLPPFPVLDVTPEPRPSTLRQIPLLPYTPLIALLNPHLKPHPNPKLNLKLIPKLNPHLNPKLIPKLNPHRNPKLIPKLNPKLNPHLNPHLYEGKKAEKSRPCPRPRFLSEVSIQETKTPVQKVTTAVSVCSSPSVCPGKGQLDLLSPPCLQVSSAAQTSRSKKNKNKKKNLQRRKYRRRKKQRRIEAAAKLKVDQDGGDSKDQLEVEEDGGDSKAPQPEQDQQKLKLLKQKFKSFHQKVKQPEAPVESSSQTPDGSSADDPPAPPLCLFPWNL
ncbi:uncharacterized protein [Antennarius striatus]|uniref:uncharacterized protein n=1 Tax=Antennarius striatus TaxID=241820 RepID=UPI0035B4F8CE